MTVFPSQAPRAALLGRPNVGKSTLFNRLIRSNRAITHDRPGITRDRMEGLVRRRGEEDFTLIDTGGVTLGGHARVEEGPEGIRGFEEIILRQAREAVQEAALLCLVVDAKDGLTPFDQHLADFLRKAGKPLLLVVNKVDGPENAPVLMAEFHGLGLPMTACSAAHGWNIRALEEAMRDVLFPPQEQLLSAQEVPPPDSVLVAGASKRLKKKLLAAHMAPVQAETASPDADPEQPLPAPTEEATDLPADMADPTAPLRLALLGRPNAGKSSLVNAMVGKERMIVSDVAGTTRDSVDVHAEIKGIACTFVDTAGVRRRTRITDTVERYSVNSSLKSTTKAHVTLFLLDALEGITQQDKRLIELLHERKTPFMVLVNKADLIAPKKRKETERDFKEALTFCPHVPLVFISAMKRRNLARIIPLALAIRKECGVRIGTGQLNRAMASVLERHQPPVVRRSRPKFFYLTQAESAPPTFVFFVSDAERILPSYARYLEKSLRKLFAIEHAPMRVHFRSSHKKKDTKG